MKETIKLGRELGRKHFAAIAAKGERWKKRNVPGWIRQSMFVPYYVVERDNKQELHIIHPPLRTGDKVHFIVYARSEIEEEGTQIRNCQK